MKVNLNIMTNISILDLDISLILIIRVLLVIAVILFIIYIMILFSIIKNKNDSVYINNKIDVLKIKHDLIFKKNVEYFEEEIFLARKNKR